MSTRRRVFVVLVATVMLQDFDTVAVSVCSADHDCGPSEYCAENGRLTLENGQSICTHCINCYSLYQSEGEAPITGHCPERCSCTSHSQCEEKNGFCAVYRNHKDPNDHKHICTSCSECIVAEGGARSFDSDHCPENCLCSSSSDCPDGHYCSTYGRSDRAALQENRGVCLACNDTITGGCVDSWSIGPAAESSCEQVCPETFECDTHEDCKGSDWCSLNHKCHECSHKCWTPPGLSPAPSRSFNLKCPESCCKWDDVDQRYRSQLGFRIGFCDPMEKVEAYWMRGFLPEWNATNFRKFGIPCHQRNYNDTSIPVVTVVDCYDAEKWCQAVDITVAFVIKNSSDGNVSLWRDVLTQTHDLRSDSCHLELFLSVLFLILCVLGACTSLCCIYTCWHGCYRATYGSSPSPRGSGSDGATIDGDESYDGSMVDDVTVTGGKDD